ncbi:hypothetical protein SLEP1_g58716 [Rubroshorea leprosula]|uniref:Uncharacterized protein n=1 Tax=Rubroshorea leprosula TaxID=152421 RepID=A0AAV5MRR6_9ROSI|nr:hypothetical protein SLEP1_g58716 [Rubroshorea leprosula]
MQAMQKPGVIINLGSSAGLYPSTKDPIYSSSKAGVVLFTRSLAPYKRQGIRVNVLCPEPPLAVANSVKMEDDKL